MNELPEGWLKAMGITITLATSDEVRAELMVGPEHLQGYGIVHGGVHCGLIESLASIGAYLYAQPKGQHVVGLENNTSFIRAVRAGAKVTMPLDDMFWGDRYGKVEDPFGHQWSIGTHVREVTPEEMRKAMEKMA